MNLIFIVQGEGRGHMAQAIALNEMLEKENHYVARVLLGTSPQRTVPTFFRQQFKDRLYTFLSPNFLLDKREKRLSLTRSFLYNAIRIPKYIRSIIAIKKIIRTEKPDAVINFYDLLGGFSNLHLRKSHQFICLAHQYYFLHPSFRHPEKFNLQRFFLWLHTWLTKIQADKILALSFRPEPPLPGKKLVVLPPLIRNRIRNIQPDNKGYILGYILNPGYYHEILQWHKEHPQICIHLFWDKKQKELAKQDNVFVHYIDYEAFIQYFKDCAYYISTAGFESIAEAMYLKKPVLIRPNQNHYEQKCNARDAGNTGAGVISKDFNLSKIFQHGKEVSWNHTAYREWVDASDGLFIRQLTGKLGEGSVPPGTGNRYK